MPGSQETKPERKPHVLEEGAVETMFDRPVAQLARFVGACVVLFFRALWRPWRIGREAADGALPTPPPFAWLAATLFTAGVTFRLWFAIEAAPVHEVSFIADLRMAVGELSLPRVLMITLPCVLMVALCAALFSRILGSAPRLDEDTLVTAACYALGWQFTTVALFFGCLIMMLMSRLESPGSLNDELNQGLPVVVLLAFTWGALILAPVMRRRLRGSGYWAWPVGLIGSGCFTAPLFITTLWVLGQSVDLHAAIQMAEARQERQWLGGLRVNLIDARENQDGSVEMTVAYTSLSDHLLVVPRARVFEPETRGRHFKVLESSIDWLPDRALLVEPSETRIAEYTLESVPTPPVNLPEGIHQPIAYTTAYYLREPDGGFLQGLAKFYPPDAVAAKRAGDWIIGPAGQGIRSADAASEAPVR